MKKIILLLAFAVMAMTAMAQEKVAILETVDKAGDISYGIKLLLRSSLTSAISSTPGYEGYDRVDMAAIAGEQEFQRTGNVSDDQIRQLGVASGAKYVLVAEAAKYDEVRIIITAKLLDVETFGVKSSGVQISGTSADEMQRSCEQLAKMLFKPKREPAQVTTPVAPLPIQTYTPKIKYRRTTWAGLSIEGGMMHYEESDQNNFSHREKTYYFAGAILDLSFPIFNWLSLGPYGGAYVVPFSSGKYVYGYRAGGMLKLTFGNNFALMAGGGANIYNQRVSPEIRLGIKFRPPVFMTFTYSGGDYDYDDDYIDSALLLGIGFSLGGTKKPVE